LKLTLKVNGAARLIEILSPAPACRFRLDEDPERAADVVMPGPGLYSILLDGRSYDVQVERTPRHSIVVLNGHRFEIEVHDPRRWAGQSSRRGGGDVESVAAPMPGKVVRVLVAAGDTVEAGQGLLVVEAMKMQNEMKAARAGRVITVTVAEGATVTAGEVLATIAEPTDR
jgi:biotin carboxyl carrier protein